MVCKTPPTPGRAFRKLNWTTGMITAGLALTLGCSSVDSRAESLPQMRRNLIELATGMREIDGAAYSAEAVQAAALALAIGGDVQTALAITRSMPKSEPVEQARTLQAIATIAGELGETDQVQSLLQEAFAAANAIPNQDGDNDYYQRVSKVERLSEIAFVANEFGETSLAQTALKEALTIAKTLQPGFREDSASRQIAFDET